MVLIHFVVESACFDDVSAPIRVEIRSDDQRAIGEELNFTQEMLLERLWKESQLGRCLIMAIAQIGHDVHRLRRKGRVTTQTNIFAGRSLIDRILRGETSPFTDRSQTKSQTVGFFPWRIRQETLRLCTRSIQ